MTWLHHHNTRRLLFDAGISCSLTVIVAAALEWLKPGIISNAVDLTILIIVTIIIVAIAGLVGEKMSLSGWWLWYYALWFEVTMIVVLKVLVRLSGVPQWLWWPMVGIGTIALIVLIMFNFKRHE